MELSKSRWNNSWILTFFQYSFNQPERETLKNLKYPYGCCWNYLQKVEFQARSQVGGEGGEGEGGGLPPAQLKQVQFVLNIKHAFFDAMS